MLDKFEDVHELGQLGGRIINGIKDSLHKLAGVRVELREDPDKWADRDKWDQVDAAALPKTHMNMKKRKILGEEFLNLEN
ncbi:MAG: hypothetical protein LBU35_00105 [Holosporales bacterium]|nr:hypothetical protein [Holosporales bacterium]